MLSGTTAGRENESDASLIAYCLISVPVAALILYTATLARPPALPVTDTDCADQITPFRWVVFWRTKLPSSLSGSCGPPSWGAVALATAQGVMAIVVGVRLG